MEAIESLLYQTMPNAPSEVLINLIGGLSKNHLPATKVGEIASKADVKKVVLTHFVPLPLTKELQRRYLDDVSSTFKGEVVLANDLAVF